MKTCRRGIAALLAGAGLAGGHALAEPTPAACAPTRLAPRCEILAPTPGAIAYVVPGSVRIDVYRAGRRVRCVRISGPEAGNMWGGLVEAGDVVRVRLLGGEAALVATGGTPVAGGGIGSWSPCS